MGRALLVVLLALPLLAEDPAADLVKAHNLARTGEYDAAEPILEKIVKATPAETRAWIDLVQVHALRGDVTKAADAVDRALAANPDSPPILTARAEVLLSQGKEDDALASLEKAVDKDAKCLRARYLRDRLWLLRGKRDEAEKDLEIFYEYYNNSDSSTSEELTELARGLWLSATRKGERATQKKVADGSSGILVDATRIDPENVDAHLFWGECYLEKHDADAARGRFNAALKINPKHPAAYVGLAGCAIEEGHLDAGVAAAGRAFALNGERPRQLGAHQEAKFALTRIGVELVDPACLKTDLDEPRWVLLSAAYEWLSGREGFNESRTRYETLRPVSADLYLFLGDLLMRRMRFAEAKDCYAKAVEKDPHEPRAAVGLALALLRTGEEEKGRRALESAYLRDPFNLWAKATTEYYQTVRDEFVSQETMHTVVRCHTDEASLLGAYIPPMAEGTWQWLHDHLGFEGPTPLHIDVVPTVAMFQARTVGLPWARPPVAAFGNVVVVLSPNVANQKRMGHFSWSRAVRNGVAQAWLLHASDHRIPLPLLQGLPDALLPSPPSWPVEVLRALDAGTLPSRQELLAGVPRREDALLPGAARAAGTTIDVSVVKAFLEACRGGHAPDTLADYPGKVPSRRPGRLRLPTDPRTADALKASLTGRAEDAAPLAKLADIALSDDRGAEALDLAGKSLDLDPKQPLALRVKAAALGGVKGKWADARAAYEAAIAAGAGDADNWLALADAEAKSGQPASNRIDSLTKARDRCPEWTGKGSPHDLLASALEEAKNSAGLLDVLATWSSAAPEDGEVALRLARALREAGHKEEALAAFERGLESDLLDLKAHVEVGELSAELGGLDRALTAYGTALLLLEGLNKDHRYDRSLASLTVKRAGVYLAQGKKKECRTDLHRALLLDPGNPEAEKLGKSVGD